MTTPSPLSLPHEWEPQPAVLQSSERCKYCGEGYEFGSDSEDCELRTLRAQVEIARRATTYWVDVQDALENHTDDVTVIAQGKCDEAIRELAAALGVE